MNQTITTGKDATEEFNMIHPPDVIGKYLNKEAVLGKVVEGGAAPAAAAATETASSGKGLAKVPKNVGAMTLANMVEFICFKPWGYYK